MVDVAERHIERYEEEIRLAQKMKENYCNASGKEVNKTKSAEILHKIGLIYRERSPDKFSLIKSAGLYNAAIVRNPSSVLRVKSDLFDLCQHILKISNAKQQTANLIEYAEKVKTSITELRNNTTEFLETEVPQTSNTYRKRI